MEEPLVVHTALGGQFVVVIDSGGQFVVDIDSSGLSRDDGPGSADGP